MSLVKRSNMPMLGGSWLTDFFDDERFQNTPWLNGRGVPAVNIRESEKGYEVELSAPGYEKRDFHISIEDGLLTLSAERNDEMEEKENNFTRKEFLRSSFSRSFSLPPNISDDDVDAKYQDGVLKLVIGKKTQPNGKPKKMISVK